MRKVINKISQRGSMMVEALAMLGLITMVTPVLYKKAAERTTELQDINTATQLRSLSKALDEYISDNYEDLANSVNYGSYKEIDKADVVPYLPYSFNVEASKLFDNYQFAVRHEVINEGQDTEHSALTGAVLGNLSAELPKIRSAKIASMVGANGGVVDADGNIGGVQGGWGAGLDEFGFDGATNGSLVSMSTHAVTASGDGASAKHVLYRDDSKGAEYNTMQTALFMGENPIEEVTEIIAADNGTVNIKDSSLLVDKDLDVGNNFSVNTLAQTITAALPTTITKTLNVTGATTLGNTLNVTGATTLGNNLSVTGNTSLTGTLDVTGATTLKNGLTVANKTGTTLTGNLTVEDATTLKNTLTVTDGNATTLGGDLTVKGNTTLNGNLTAPNIIATEKLSAGVGDNYTNFVADESSVKVINPNVDLAGKVKIGTNEITATQGNGTLKLDDSGIYYTSKDNNNQSGKLSVTAAGAGALTTTNTIDLTSKDISFQDKPEEPNFSLVLANASINATIKDGASWSLSGNEFYAKKDGGVISVKEDLSKLHNDKKVLISQEPANGPTNKIEMAEAKITIDSNNLYVGNNREGVDESFKYLASFHMTKDDIMFSSPADIDEETPAGGSISKAPAIPSDNSVLTKGVHINRKGIIHLPTADTAADASGNYLAAGNGEQGVPGYIKLDRIIANRKYDDENHSGASKAYDAYQVNPAYTSVMHDIKLTTRGGARLSDILPDFINKGIYVLDNTYKEDDATKNWDELIKNETDAKNVNTTGLSGVKSCNSVDDIASPWLGFVPAPQCPPGYSKVVTINPIRWKMAEAFYVPGIVDLTADDNSSFRQYFVPRTNPLNAEFKIYEANGKDVEKHSHVVETGWPLTFQTNTWLNTTVSGVNPSGTFLGWNAIMGFLYYADDYEDYLRGIGKWNDTFSGRVMWNLFPVYSEELTAVTNVYCFFDRRAVYNSGNGSSDEWNSNLVDTGYDQVGSFRSGLNKGTEDKDKDYQKRLNDPALGYDDVW